MDGRIIFKVAGEILGELEVGEAVFGLDDDGKAAESAKGFFNSLIIGFDFFSVERVLQLNFPAKVFDGVDREECQHRKKRNHSFGIMRNLLDDFGNKRKHVSNIINKLGAYVKKRFRISSCLGDNAPAPLGDRRVSC